MKTTNGLDMLRAAVLLGMRMQKDIDEIIKQHAEPPKRRAKEPTPNKRGHWTQMPEGRKRMTAIQKARWKTTKQIERGVLKAAR